MANIATRTIGLVVVAIVAFAVWGYAQQLTAAVFFPVTYPRPYFEMVTCAVVGALAASLVASFPLAWLLHHRAWFGAILASLPVLALRVPDMLSYSGPLPQEVRLMGVVEAGTYLALLVAVAVVVSAHWPKPKVRAQAHNAA
jgi:hypothetical protein